mgnify:FL=1
MLVTTHVMVAASLGVILAPSHPWLAFVLGLASHLMIDIIPHGDSALYKAYKQGERVNQAHAYTGIDAACAVIETAWSLNQPLVDGARTVVFWAMVGGVLPDILVGIREYLNVLALERFRKIHFFFHDLLIKRYGDVPFLMGLGIEATVIVALVAIVWR